MAEAVLDRVPSRTAVLSRAAPLGLIALILIAAALPILSLQRMPTPFADVQLYASIARARQLYGIGVPTITWNSPLAVDHIPFYGPVFFDLCALALRLFGVSLRSFRLVSLAGAGLYVLGSVLLARQLTGSSNRMLLAAALTLLTPEVNFGASTGAMHMLAVGFQVPALAAFVGGLDRQRAGAEYGAMAGLCLALAALTTPRSYPFVFAFVCASGAAALFGTSRKLVAHRLGAAMLVFAVVIGTWARVSHGSVAAWGHYLGYIVAHEDTDIALLPTAERTFSFHWSGVLTPAVAIIGALLAAWSINRRRSSSADPASRPSPDHRAALAVLLGCAWIDLVVNVAALNYTFTIGEYIALPLFAVIAAWPWARGARLSRALIAGACLVLTLDAAHVGYRYVSVAPVWRAHDPALITAFIGRHVPAGSEVIGPDEPFFFPVERSGSRYRVVSPRSWADWARWVPHIEPAATDVARRIRVAPSGARFLLWPSGEDLPDGYRCAGGSRIATFDAPGLNTWWPGWIVRRAVSHPDPGYPSAVLYRLPAGCPVGYDPTRAPGT